MPRIPYVTYDELSPEKQAEINKHNLNWDDSLNVFKVLANSPVVYDAFGMLGGKLFFDAELNPKYRELVILRIAILKKSRYEWAQHVPLAFTTGITAEQVTGLINWESSNLFSPEERTILRYTDEVIRDTRPTDQTFQDAAIFLSKQSLTELTLAIGYWNMVALFLNTLKVEVEDNYHEKHGKILPDPEPEW
ncbi:MAG: carboxymuconolactone decarboxylase family protein [Proteobacteria bacterium]|nr:carboxymuconolactone decarboxylase family protein [Pseudomonadota bacterium]